MRAAYAATTAVYRHASAGLASVSDRSIRAADGAVRIRIYVPHTTAAAPLPCLVYFHGGGWVVGDLDSHDHLCRYVAGGAASCVVAVDYRLAPEHKFPKPLDDCVAAFNWVAANAGELNIDPMRLALGGDSAGGNLAAAAAIDLRDAGRVQPRLQWLIYPGVDFTADNESLRENANGYLLTRAALTMFTDFYLPDADARLDPRASPQRCSDHRDLPRAFIQSAEFDPLRDEAHRYAETLIAAGCRVDYTCYPGMVHGFARMGGKVDMALRALDDACAVLRDVFDA
jgi:acetyl esterase